MKISVVMATCNGERYMPEQLASLLAQSRPPDELLIGDDASDDHTVEIAREFAKMAPFTTRVVRNRTRLGYKQNFSRLAAQASGDILAFCDQDDAWSPVKLSILEDCFSRDAAATCVIHDAVLIDGSGRTIAPSYLGHLRESRYSSNFFVKGCATAIRASLARAAFPLPTDSAWAHDNIVHVAAMITRSRRIITEPLMKHRIHAGNTSGFVAPKSTLRRRLNMLAERLEISRMPSELRPLLLPKGCAERDIDLLFDIVSRMGIEPARHVPQAFSYVRAFRTLSSFRDEVRNAPAPDGVRLVMTARKRGTFRALGAGKVAVLEGLRVLLLGAKRRRRGSEFPSQNS